MMDQTQLKIRDIERVLWKKFSLSVHYMLEREVATIIAKPINFIRSGFRSMIKEQIKDEI